MSKLSFTVAYSSGEDIDYPARELNVHSPHTVGWQSPRFCDFPQEVGLALSRPSRLSQVQLLSHQSKIATKIELYVGEGGSYSTANWKRLGYLSLADNSQSDYQARELKSVYIDCTGAFLKLLVHKCYLNTHNIYNQVGIVAVNLLGDYVGGPSSGEVGVPAAPFGAVDGGGGGGLGGGGRMNDLAFDMNLDPESASRIRQIVAAKERAVELEDYDAAKRLKEAEGQLCQLGVQLAQLEVSKRQAVKSEDYDRAKVLKTEIQSLRGQIAESLAAVDASLRADIGGFSVGDNRAINPSPFSPRGNQGAAPGGVVGAGFPRGQHPPREPPSGVQPSPQAPPSARYDPQPGPVHGGDTFDEDAPLPAQRQGGGPRGVAGDAAAAEGMDGGFGAPPEPQHAHAGHVGPSPVRHSNEFARALPRGGPQDFGATPERGPGPMVEELPPGPHPLEGVPGFEELPSPEPLSPTSAGEATDVNGLLQLFGDYRVRCLVSKQWNLREAAIIKAKLLMPELIRDGGLANILQPFCQVLKLGVADKIAQVFATSLGLLDDLCHVLSSDEQQAASPQILQKLLEPTAHMLVLKLGENQPRVRESAFDSLLAVAHCQAAGCDFVVRCATKALPKKQTGNRIWRPLATRLQLLTNLVDLFGVNQSSGLSTDTCMKFVRDNNATSHTFSEVRDAARELTVSLYRHVGTSVEPYLSNLRVKQREEYEQAFQQAIGGGAPPAPGSMQDPPHARPGPGEAGPPPGSRGRGRGRGRAPAGDGPGEGPTTRREQNSAQEEGPSPRSQDFGQSGGGAEMDQMERAMENFKDQIMLQLEDQAFSIDEAHNILTIHFGTSPGDAVKDRVLMEWCSEVGLTKDVAQMSPEDRKEALRQVAHWLFQ